MKKLLVGFLLMFAVISTASAGVQINTNGLTETQKAELVKQAEAMKMENTPFAGQSSSVEVAEKWINFGERFGKMIGSAAREVGVAANEFLQTPVGLMTASVIVFHYVGDTIIHVFTGIILLVAGFSFIIYFVRRRSTVEIKYDTEKRNVFGNYPVIQKVRNKMDDDTFGWVIAMYVFTLAISAVILATA